jgi:Flp pilus assembly protein TadG
MMNPWFILRDRSANAAVELALVTPLLLALMWGSVELGNLFLSQHVLEKQVRDGARYASRLALNSTYSCPGSVFADVNATNHIINVTETGAISGSGFARWDSTYWGSTCDGDQQTVTVSIACVAKDDIDTTNSGDTGIYTSLNGEIPVVTVEARVKYLSVLSTLGFNATNLCMTAKSTASVQGI